MPAHHTGAQIRVFARLAFPAAWPSFSLLQHRLEPPLVPCRYNPNGLDAEPVLHNAVTQNSADRKDLVSWW